MTSEDADHRDREENLRRRRRGEDDEGLGNVGSAQAEAPLFDGWLDPVPEHLIEERRDSLGIEPSVAFGFAVTGHLTAKTARTSTSFTIFEGTSEIQRMIIGRAVNGLNVR